jgi:protein FAM32A
MVSSPAFTGGSLSFKGDKKKKNKKAKKKKQKSKHSISDQEAAAVAESLTNDIEEEAIDEMTEAERKAFIRKQKREMEEMESVARKSHRERVEDFNEKLGQLTEHNDIPRVSAAGNG